MILREKRGKILCRNVQNSQAELDKYMSAAPDMEARLLKRGTKMELWLTMLPSTVNGTELGYQEFLYALFLRYGVDPPDLPPHCDRYNSAFSICHALY